MRYILERKYVRMALHFMRRGSIKKKLSLVIIYIQLYYPRKQTPTHSHLHTLLAQEIIQPSTKLLLALRRPLLLR
jgi:hypothetical protein